MFDQGLNVPLAGSGHHLQIFLGDEILPNSWVMLNLDMYQPLLLDMIKFLTDIGFGNWVPKPLRDLLALTSSWR